MNNDHVLQLSLKLEYAFRVFSDSMNISRDAISNSPTEAIETGLGWLYANGIITKSDLSMMCQEYNWGTMSLREAMASSNAEEKICELISRLTEIAEKK